MARNIGTLGTELTKFNIITATLVHLDWHLKDDTGAWKPAPLYLTNAGQNIIHAGNTYQAIGGLGSITGGEEGTELQSYSTVLTLTGIPTEFMKQVFNDLSFANAYTNRPAYIYTAFLDTNYNVLDQPVLIFSGQMDSATVQVDKEVTVQITVESRLIDWEKPRGGRFNAETQKARFPNDTGFDFIPDLLGNVIRFPGGVYGDQLPEAWDGE